MDKSAAAEREVRLTLPERAAALLGGRDEDLAPRIREAVLVDLFRRREVTAGEAAELLGATRWDFIEILGKHRVPLAEYEEGELEAEVKAAEAKLGR